VDHKDRKEYKEQPEQLEYRVLKDHKVRPDPAVLKDIMD
jgi:hypothetical protein